MRQGLSYCQITNKINFLVKTNVFFVLVIVLMIERKKYGIIPLCASGKEKYISGAADFGAAARPSHGFHTRPNNSLLSAKFAIKSKLIKQQSKFSFCVSFLKQTL